MSANQPTRPPGSGIYAAKVRLVSLMDATAGLAAWEVMYGPPASLGLRDIWLYNARATQERRAMRQGHQPVNDDFTITIIIQCLGQQAAGDSDQQYVDRQVFDAFGALQQALAVDAELETVPDPDGVEWAINWMGISDYEVFAGRHENRGHAARIEADLTGRANLRIPA